MDVIAIAQIILVFQIVIFTVLVTGFILKRRNRLFPYRATMLIAVMLNVISIFLVMGPHCSVDYSPFRKVLLAAFRLDSGAYGIGQCYGVAGCQDRWFVTFAVCH